VKFLNRFYWTIPKEHGAWSIAITCWLIGFVISGVFDFKALFILLSVITGMMLRYSVVLLFKEYFSSKPYNTGIKVELDIELILWLIFYSIIFLSSSFILIFTYKRWLLLPIGFVIIFFILLNVAIENYKLKFTIYSEIAGITGLSIIAPATHYTMTGILNGVTLFLWLMCLLFFTGSVFHVRSILRNRPVENTSFIIRFKNSIYSIIYHLSVLFLSIILSTFSIFPTLAPLSFIPVSIKSLWYVFKPQYRKVSIREVGYIELFHTVVFTLITIIVIKL